MSIPEIEIIGALYEIGDKVIFTQEGDIHAGLIEGIYPHHFQVFSHSTGRCFITRDSVIEKLGDDLAPKLPYYVIGEDSHLNHEIVENYAGGKSFKYCRNCKIEVQ